MKEDEIIKLLYDIKEELKEEMAELRLSIEPTKRAVKNSVSALYWLLRIIGGAIVLFLVSQYLTKNDMGNSSINYNKHSMGFKKMAIRRRPTLDVDFFV